MRASPRALLALLLLAGPAWSRGKLKRVTLPEMEAQIQEAMDAGAFPEELERLNKQADAMVAKHVKAAEKGISRDRAAQAHFFGEAQRLKAALWGMRDADQRILALRKAREQIRSVEERLAYWEGVESGADKSLRENLDRLEAYTHERALGRKERLWSSRTRIGGLCSGAKKAAAKELEILREIEGELAGPVEP